MAVDVLRRPARIGLTRAQLTTEYQRDRLGFLLAMARRHGPVVELTPGTVLVADPIAMHEIYRRSNTDFFISQNMRGEPVAGHIGDPELDQWMLDRRAALRAISPRVLDEHRQWLLGEAHCLCDRWLRQGTIRKPLADLEDLTARSFARFCFGSRTGHQVPVRTRQLTRALTPIQGSPLRLPRHLQVLPRYRRADLAHRALEAEMAHAVESPGSGGLVDSLIGAGLDRASLVKFLISSNAASAGVPAAAIAWILIEIAGHDEIAEEIVEAGASCPEIVSWTVKEGLRLWPPSWLAQRTTEREQSCGGWLLPADAALILSPYVVHRTAACFAAPLEFRPHRWRDLNPPVGAYVPYGLGPRWCLGARVADMELETVVEVITTRLRVRLSGKAIRPDSRHLLRPDGLRLRVQSR